MFRHSLVQTPALSFGAAAVAAAVAAAYVYLRRSIVRKPRAPSSEFVRGLEALVFDCDGVLYHNSSAIDGVPEALAALRKAGKRCFFVTNAASQSRASLAKKLSKLGILAAPEECITAASAAAAYLAKHRPDARRAYVVGGGGLFEELRLSGIEPIGEGDLGGLDALLAAGGLEACLPIDAVVVGAQMEDLCYHRLAKAVAYARDPSRAFVATNPDANYPAGCSELLPAGGCNVSFVSYGAERPPDAIVGKPSVDLAHLVGKLYGLQPATTCMVGDRCNTDMAFGRSVGWHTCLVLSGCHGWADVARAPAGEVPECVASSVVELAACL